MWGNGIPHTPLFYLYLTPWYLNSTSFKPLFNLFFTSLYRGQNLNANFFSQTFRAVPGYPGEITGYPAQKVWFPCVSRDIPNFLAPTRSRGRPPPHQKISGPKTLCLCSFLRGPVAILFIISRDTCSDSIGKLFRACFCGVSHNYRAIRCQMGYRTDVPV